MQHWRWKIWKLEFNDIVKATAVCRRQNCLAHTGPNHGNHVREGHIRVEIESRDREDMREPSVLYICWLILKRYTESVYANLKQCWIYPLLQTVANRKVFCALSYCRGLRWHAESNPIEFCAVVLEIYNKGWWLGAGHFCCCFCLQSIRATLPMLDWLIMHTAWYFHWRVCGKGVAWMQKSWSLSYKRPRST